MKVIFFLYGRTDIFRNCSCGTKRVYKKDEEGKVSRYFFDTIGGIDQVLITYNEDGQAKKIYTYGNTTDQPISMQYRSDQEGEGQGQWKTTAYYLYDGQGNVRQMVNSRGQVIATYNYLPFGEMMNRGMRGQGTKENGGMGITLGRLQNWGRENELRNTITYQGREYDRDSGLYYYRARYQNPTLGRFLEVDPLLREVPNYTTGNSWPTNGNSGCGCGGGGSVNSAPYIPYIFTPQQMVPTLPENIAITNLYILENNNPVNVKDPTGFKGFWTQVVYHTGPTVTYGLLRIVPIWYAYYWEKCATLGIPDDSSVNTSELKFQVYLTKWITIGYLPWGVGDIYLDSTEYTSYIPFKFTLKL